MKKQRKMRHLIGLTVLLSFFIFPYFYNLTVFAIEEHDFLPEVSKGDIQFYVDYATFKNLEDEEKVYLEVYFAIVGDQLTFVPRESMYCAVAELFVVLGDERGSRVATEHSKLGCTVGTFEETQTKIFLFDVIGFMVQPGEYTLDVKVKDGSSTKESTNKVKIQTLSFLGGQLMLSQIQLAARIEPDTSGGKFVKNERRITPNPMRMYGIKWQMLYFYAEVYNLAGGGEEPSTYSTQYTLLDEQGNAVKEFPARELEKPGNSSIVMSGLNVVTLPNGLYSFQIRIVDNTTSQEAVTWRNFQILKPQPGAGEGKEIPEEFTEEVAKRELDLIKYIASKDELKMYKDLSIEGKRQFLKDFWKRRDPSPETPTNEFRREHLLRYEKANQLYTFGKREGWKTDFGRILIIYGEPDDIERHTHEIDTKPYQVWHYFSIQGGVQFIFGDLDGFGNYRLIHSTARNEIYDPNYLRWLQQSQY